ncbi:MAG TPA: hypothetical protein V6D18_15270 [Thermosynechococcaceae cyanobacterium]|jgi:hypothetical protein
MPQLALVEVFADLPDQQRTAGQQHQPGLVTAFPDQRPSSL